MTGFLVNYVIFNHILFYFLFISHISPFLAPYVPLKFHLTPRKTMFGQKAVPLFSNLHKNPRKKSGLLCSPVNPVCHKDSAFILYRLPEFTPPGIT